MSDETVDVLVVGGGVAGRTASVFTARNGLETLVVDAGGSRLRRNAHLENFPGFPAGIDARLLLDALSEQATTAGATVRDGRITDLRREDAGFEAETAAGATVSADRVVAATKSEVDFLASIPAVEIQDRGKPIVVTDDRGRTGVPGLYAAGRLAGKPHQAAVAAGHGAEVAVRLLEDADVPFYHDWVVPEGYFTGRDRRVPPGVEELSPDERDRRVQTSLEWFADAAGAEIEAPEQHPDVEG